MEHDLAAPLITSPSKEKPDSLARAAQVATVILPVLVAVIAASFPFAAVWMQTETTAAVARQTNDAKLLDLAVGILRDQPKPDTIDVRLWAADLIDKASPEVPLPESVRAQLSKTVVLPGQAGVFPAGAITISPGEIRRGESAVLSWSTANARKIIITPGVGEVGANGSLSVSPKETTTYTIMLLNDIGHASANTMVLVR